MFFQLLEIQTLSKNSHSLEEARDKLNGFLLDAYQTEPKVKQSLNSTIHNILSEANRRLDIFSKIESDTLTGYLIPSYMDFQAFTQGRGELPEWTRSVLEKEYQKQKGSLEVIVRKIYSTHGLSNFKSKFEQQINSFRVLADRYKVLSQHEQTIDIMKESETLHSLTKLAGQKFLAFLHLVASKITSFIEEVTSKCQNLGIQLNSINQTNTKTIGFPQGILSTYQTEIKNFTPFEKSGTESNWLAKANHTLGKKTVQRQQSYLLRQPRWINTYSSNYYI